jgi:hypothetical protein
MAGLDIINCVPNMTIDDKELHFTFEYVKITTKNDGLLKRSLIKRPGGWKIPEGMEAYSKNLEV